MTISAIACLAGRRIDPNDRETPRFPLQCAPAVGEAIAAVLKEQKIARLVCAAACGADILGLEACQALDIPATIILPYAAAEFREVSVTDRPGDWGPRFDRVVARARTQSDLIELGYERSDKNAFSEVNQKIVSRVSGANAREKFAIIVWEGLAHGEDDFTADLAEHAGAKGLKIIEILTMGRT